MCKYPYWGGSYDKKTMTFTPDNTEPGFVDRGDYYAVNPHMVDDKGSDGSQRRIMHAWVRNPPSPTKSVAYWQGIHSIPRVITLKDGRLIQKPIPELQVLRGEKQSLQNLIINPNSTGIIESISGDALEIIANFKPNNARRFGLKVRVSPDGKINLPVWYDIQKSEFGIADKHTASDVNPGQTVKMHIFVDRSVIEAFVNGKAITKVAYLNPEAEGIELFAEDGDCILECLDVWKMNPIW